MPAGRDEFWANLAALLPQLIEHVDEAERLLAHLPHLPHLHSAEGGEASEAGEHGPATYQRILVIARQALGYLTELTDGTRRVYPPHGGIALRHSTGDCQVLILGQPSGDEVAEFIADLRQFDQRLQISAELCGLLLGLALRWSAAGFAPPVVLASLGEHVPQFLALGQALLQDQS